MAKQTSKEIVMTKDDYIAVGYDLAQHMVEAEQTMEQTKRNLIMGVVGSYRMPEQVEAILFGVAKFYTDKGATDSTVRVRKSEVKAVFDAVAKTEVSEDNIQKLKDFVGGYNAWIDFARELRGKNSPRNTSGRGEKTQLTEKQQAKVHETIADANNEQLVTIATDAMKNIVAHIHKEQPEQAQLAGKQTLIALKAQAELLAKSDKFDKFFQNVGKQLLEVLVPALDQIKQAEDEAAKVHEMAQGERQEIAA